MKIPFSVLELAVVNNGDSTLNAINNSMAVAKKVDELGYNRIWFAEHHNMKRIASSATSLLIARAAEFTQKIRVGSGGIMLPNHSPLVIAEQFGTLETLYPGRIDLGLGRAPGTDQTTAHALRRDHLMNAQNFPNQVKELQEYFLPTDLNAKVHAYPGEGLEIPFWILGSSTDSSHLAASMGLPYAFATHFAPAQFEYAIEIYHHEFKASQQQSTPYMMACVNAIVAETDEEADLLATSYFNMIVDLVTGQTNRGLMPPGELAPLLQHPEIRQAVDNFAKFAFIGSKETVDRKIQSFVNQYNIQELMITSHIFDLDKKLNSFELLNQIQTA